MIFIPFNNFHAARVSDPDKYDKVITKDLGEGINLLIGYFNEGDEEKSEPQSYHFDKEKFTPDEVKKYLEKHDIKTIELEFAEEDKESGSDDTKENETYVTHIGDVVDDPESINDYPNDDNKKVSDDENEDWNSAKAKEDLVKWATDSAGKINKRQLMRYFLDVDGGDAQNIDSYRYVVAALVDDVPQYCNRCLNDSWDLASGKLTGISNRNVMKKIIFLKEREGIPMTEEQMDFVERHMSSPSEDMKLNEHILEDANEMGNIAIIPEKDVKFNSTLSGSKVIYEDDNVIDVPVVPMREGVFTGIDGIPTLKKFEYFGNDAHWLEGQPILKGHTGPTEIVTYRHNRIGKLMNVIPRPDKKDVVAVARYYKNKLSPEDLNRIRSDVPYDGSIAYTTHTSMIPGEYNGSKYNAIEDGGYHFYHFAELANGKGACSHDE